MAKYGTEVIGRFDGEFGNRTADRSLPAADGPGFFLPPYSQELNPDELVRAHVKTRVAKAATQTRDELGRMVDQTLRRLQTLPDIVAGFFRVLTCRYAAAAVPV